MGRLTRSFAALAVVAAATTAHAVVISQINLVTDDQSTNAAKITDPNLINPWGISYSATSPFWVSDNGTGVSTLYTVNATTNATTKGALTVAIPGAGNVTGQVFNSSSSAFNGDRFLFVSEDGTISGWRPALNATAETLVIGSSANVYKGTALATIGTETYLYAANFRSGAIDVFDGSGASVTLNGAFTDPNLPSGYAPFNIENIGGLLYVTYALQDSAKKDDVAGVGNGFVSMFNSQGAFVQRLASGGNLNSPWGMALAPSSFGEFGGDLLVGNFGDGLINVFDTVTATFQGTLKDVNGNPIAIDGLWGLTTGNNGNGGSGQSVYFSAGPDNETHGLFGVLVAVPEPGTLALVGIASVALTWRRRRR